MAWLTTSDVQYNLCQIRLYPIRYVRRGRVENEFLLSWLVVVFLVTLPARRASEAKDSYNVIVPLFRFHAGIRWKTGRHCKVSTDRGEAQQRVVIGFLIVFVQNFRKHPLTAFTRAKEIFLLRIFWRTKKHTKGFFWNVFPLTDCTHVQSVHRMLARNSRKNYDKQLEGTKASFAYTCNRIIIA